MSVRKRTWVNKNGEPGEAWIVNYTDQEKHRRIETFATKKEAVARQAEVTVDVRKGTHVVPSASITVSEAAEEWFDAVKAGRNGRGPAEASTLRQCRYHINTYIAPKLGRWKLSSLTKSRVILFMEQLLADGTSRPLAKKVLASLKGILSEAVHRERVAINVASGVKIGNGSRTKHEVSIPEIADIKAILAELDERAGQSDPNRAKAWQRWRLLIATAIHTGMRASELRGLPWKNVDLKAGKIAVTQKADENGTIGEPKSKSSHRTISIPAELVLLLGKPKLEAGNRGLVFANKKGNPESLANIFNRAWKPIQTAVGVKHNFHALRHFHASLLIASGANPKEVMAELGHSSIQITYDLYGHIFQDEAADKLRSERADRLAGLLK